jgi:uncharacterized membrane protein
MAVALAAVEYWLPAGTTTLPAFLAIALAGGVAYVGTGLAVHAFDLSALKALAERRRRKPAAG